MLVTACTVCQGMPSNLQVCLLDGTGVMPSMLSTQLACFLVGIEWV